MDKRREWYNKPVRVLQFNIEDRYGVYVSRLNAKEIVELAKKLHVNVIVVFARDPWGRIYYREGEVGPVHPKMRGDFLRELAVLAKENNIRVVAMVGHTANKYLYLKHREWAQVNARGETILLEHVPRDITNYEPEWPQMCINSPFIDHVKKEVLEALELGVDGIFLDSFRYQPDPERACYCKWCREAFKREYGFDMPVEPDWSDSRWRKLWDWRYKIVVKRIKELYEQVKKYDKNILFMYNSHPGGWAGRTNRVVELARDYIDVVFAECSEVDHQPPGFITEMVKLTKAMNGGKPVWASRNCFHMYRTVTSTTPLAIRQGLREAIIAGGSPWLLLFSSSYIQNPEVLNNIETVFKEHELLEEYLEDAEPIRYAGIVVSNTTRDHYGKDKPEEYVDETRGFYYALTHSHIPVEFIAERDLTNQEVLSRYRLLILANTACLGISQSNSIEHYVKNGGKILATFLTSTRDEECIDRYNFALSGVLGIELKGLLKYPWSYVVLDNDHPIFNGIGKKLIPWGDMSYDFSKERTTPTLGWHTLIDLSSGVRLASIGLPVGEWGYEYTLGRSPPPYATATNSPSIVYNEYGNGKALYYTGQLGRHYWRIGLPEYKSLIANSITYLGGALPIRTNAPETLAIEAFTQSDRIIIHLLNHTYNQRILAIGIGRTKQPLPSYSSSEAVHPPRAVIPVHNIELEVMVKEYSNYKVFLPLRHRVLDYRIDNGVLHTTIPLVNEYEVVIIEPRK
mgnify:CR=1 FL=1